MRGLRETFPEKEQSFLRDLGGHGVIPWTELNWKISMTVNKEQKEKNIPRSQQPRQRESALLGTYGSPGTHFQLA